MAGWYDDSEDWMTGYNESIQDSHSTNTSSSNNNLATNIGSFIGGIIGGAVSSPRFKLNIPTLNFDNVKLNTPSASSISGSTTNNYNGSNERPQLYKMQDFENSEVNQALKQNMRRGQYRKWLKSEDYAKRKQAFDKNQYEQYAQSVSNQAAYDAKTLADKTLAEMQSNRMSDEDILKQIQPVQPVQSSNKTGNMNYWDNIAKKYGFNDMNDVKLWQKKNGLLADGKFGYNSRMVYYNLNPELITEEDDFIINIPNNQGKPEFKKFQQGGTMANNEQEIQKAFMAFLIEDAATQGMQIQSEEDLKQYVESLGQEGIQAKYQEFMKLMSGASAQKPSKRLGGHLNYLKQIKGACPDGEETYYFKEGGSVKRGCKPCMEKAKKGAKFDNEDLDPVKKFKCGRKVKKAIGGSNLGLKGKISKYNEPDPKNPQTVLYDNHGNSVISEKGYFIKRKELPNNKIKDDTIKSNDPRYNKLKQEFNKIQ